MRIYAAERDPVQAATDESVHARVMGHDIPDDRNNQALLDHPFSEIFRGKVREPRSKKRLDHWGLLGLTS